MTTRRQDAGSLVMEKPHPSSLYQTPDQAVAACAGNVQLMEARVCELTTSVRALHRSNIELSQALQQEGVDDSNDPDFVQAIRENRGGVIRRQGLVCAALVKAMQAHGAKSATLDEDVRTAVRTVELEEAAEATATAEAATQTQSTDTNAEGGLHL